MDKETNDLYLASDDIIFILNVGLKIGWEEIKPQSINRIIYLSKVLFSFANQTEPNILTYYHFASTATGPVSSVINNALIYLESNEFTETRDFGIRLIISNEKISKIIDLNFHDNKDAKQDWFRVVMLILGKYGEDKVFSFAINDPLYKENLLSNSPKEIEFLNSENATLKILGAFKEAFEENVGNTSEISRKEYLELYFDYVFSQIIK
jgi:hypothetical protein